MEIIGAALGSDLDLSTTETPALRVIAVRHYLYAVDGFLRRCDDGRSAPDGAGSTDSINRYTVVFILLARGYCLRPIFGLKNARVTAGSTGTLCSGKIVAASSASLRAIAKNARRQLCKLKDIASERGHMLNLVFANRATDRRSLSI